MRSGFLARSLPLGGNWVGANGKRTKQFRQQTEQKRTKQCVFSGEEALKLVLYSRTQAPDLVNRNRSTLGHARQAAMAELSGSQPSGPSQSSLFNRGRAGAHNHWRHLHQGKSQCSASACCLMGDTWISVLIGDCGLCRPGIRRTTS